MAGQRVDDVVPGSAGWWDAHAERLRRRRPRSGGLTVERIVDEAVRLVDGEGIEALTVRRLAGELGTSGATLYRHVASVDELLVLTVDRVLGEIQLPRPGLAARDKVVGLSVEFRRVLLRHPGVVPALRAAPLLGPNARRSADSGLANLLEMGFPPDVAVRGYLALIDFVLGSVFFDTAGAGRRAAGRRAGSEDRPPSVLDTHREQLEAVSSAEVFRFGLDAFLDGMAGQHGVTVDTRDH